MAWKNTGGKGFEFSGEMAIWVTEIKSWHEADADIRGMVALDTYLFFTTSLLGIAAKEKWASEFLGKRKVEKLDSFVSTMPDGKINMNVWNTLDFLAEKLDRQFLVTNAGKVKTTAKQMILNEAAKAKGAGA